jgi:hypothetical protein
MDPEYAKPITGVPNEPRGSTDAPDGMKNGNNQKTINGPNKNGRKVPYNPKGDNAEGPEAGVSVLTYVIDAISCISNVYMPPAR